MPGRVGASQRRVCAEAYGLDPPPRVLKISIALPGYLASSRVREKFPDRDFGTWVGAWNGEAWDGEPGTESQGRRARDGEPGTENHGRSAGGGEPGTESRKRG